VLLVLGLMVFLFALAYKGEMKAGNAIGLCLGGIVSCAALFMRSRNKESGKIFEVTDKDRAQFKELRREFAPRKLLGQLLARLGGLFIIAGICSPLYAHSSIKTEWKTALSMIVFGLCLGFCAALLVKPSFAQNRPPFWLPAISGIVCSCFILVMTGCFAVVWFTPKSRIPGWVGYILFLSLVSSVLSAIICLITGFSAVRKARRSARSPFSQSTLHLEPDVSAFHQRFAHENCFRAAFREALDIGARVDAAFGDQQRRTGISRCIGISIFFF
jgi:hypothetical protein